jgi:hypothetical protein
MDNKIRKLTQKKGKSKTSTKQDSEELITNYKNAYQEAEDCLLNNLTPVLRKQVLDILNECKKKTENISFFQKRQLGLRNCVFDKYSKANISKNVMDIEFGKCMDTLNKKKDLLNELSMLLNPDIKRVPELTKKMTKMITIGKKCSDRYCKDIKSKKQFYACIKDNECDKGNLREKINKSLKEFSKIEQKTQKLLNKIK